MHIFPHRFADGLRPNDGIEIVLSSNSVAISVHLWEIKTMHIFPHRFTDGLRPDDM